MDEIDVVFMRINVATILVMIVNIGLYIYYKQ